MKHIEITRELQKLFLPVVSFVWRRERIPRKGKVIWLGGCDTVSRRRLNKADPVSLLFSVYCVEHTLTGVASSRDSDSWPFFGDVYTRTPTGVSEVIA